ncbi:hypothetical protein PHLCEN_2v5237 [Hermanssonia centrifuga]|uniref:Uncharacterized protein n=1 Tax=Hermanssonia centrifuga TaxID=98765 RepID=A0A2R6P8P1_9APHY|nr:hypothetical protein PHLCEN_2v5237 [Hermanssonia centrifuga]
MVSVSSTEIQKSWTWQRNAGAAPKDNLGEGAGPHTPATSGIRLTGTGKQVVGRTLATGPDVVQTDPAMEYARE